MQIVRNDILILHIVFCDNVIIELLCESDMSLNFLLLKNENSMLTPTTRRNTGTFLTLIMKTKYLAGFFILMNNFFVLQKTVRYLSIFST